MSEVRPMANSEESAMEALRAQRAAERRASEANSKNDDRSLQVDSVDVSSQAQVRAEKAVRAQERLDATLRNLEEGSRQAQSTESRIRDADFAYETAEFAKRQIQQQSGVAVLAQSNNLDQGALRLLG